MSNKGYVVTVHSAHKTVTAKGLLRRRVTEADVAEAAKEAFRAIHSNP